MRCDLGLDAFACPGTPRIGPRGDLRPGALPPARRCTTRSAYHGRRPAGGLLPGAIRPGGVDARIGGRRSARRLARSGRTDVRHRDDHRWHHDARRALAHDGMPGADGAEVADGGEFRPLRGGDQRALGAQRRNPLCDSRGAAAVLLTPADDDGGVLSTTAGGAAQPDGNGDAQDRTLLRGLTEAAAESLQKAQLAISQIDVVIGEQSAPEITKAWSRLAGVASSRVLLDEARYGSLLAAAPLTALYDAVQSGRLQKGMTALVLACGSGPTWAAACLRWGDGGIAEASPGVERRA